MKVLLVNGSPNEKGCTYTALCEAAGALNEENIETEIYWLGKKPIGGCVACHGCIKLGKCVFDDAVNEFREKAMQADGFIFGTPVHYASASGNIIAFMDRLFYSDFNGNRGRAFKFKPAAAIVSARRAGTTAAFDQMNKYFTISQMPVVSSRYWNMVHGAKADDVKEDAEGMQIMRFLGRNMAYYLKCIEAGKNAGIEPPKYEKVTLTNFIR